MKRILSGFLGFLFVFFLLLVPLKAPAESVPCEESHWTEKNVEYETRYTLQDSTLYSSWTSSCSSYNCYCYAMGRTPRSKLQIGERCGKKSLAETYLYDGNVSDLADIVTEDLLKEGYVCVMQTDVRNEAVNTPAAYNVMCLRISTRGVIDFHFMKYNRSLGAWLHKPGESAILKYKYTPSPSRVWTNERYMENGPLASFVTYDSDIWYFAFAKSHYYSVKSQGDTSTHIMECRGCGKTIRQAHVLNITTNSCKICGRRGPFTSLKSIPMDGVLSSDVLLPSSEVIYNGAYGFKKGNR